MVVGRRAGATEEDVLLNVKLSRNYGILMVSTIGPGPVPACWPVEKSCPFTKSESVVPDLLEHP